jgi:transcriptional regulator with XRE-family HTH domain
VPNAIIAGVVVRQRARDRGTARGRHLNRTIGAEIRLARRQLGLSARTVGINTGMSQAEVTRIERAEAEWVSLIALARLCAVVGLDLSARAYPGGAPIRDAAHARLLEKLRKTIHRSLSWALEVPFPNAGDQRAWDALIRGEGWRFGVEAELNPMDGQALIRKLNLKRKEGMVDGVILLMPDTRQTRAFRGEFADGLKTIFTVPARSALRSLSNGLNPGGNALVIL